MIEVNKGVKNSLKNEKLYLFFIFIFSVFIDALNGYLQLQRELHLPIGVIYRLSVISILFYILRKEIRIKALFFIISFIPFLLYWSECHHSDIISEIEIFSNIIYSFLFILFFYRNIDRFNLKNLFNYIIWSGIIIAIIIFVSYIFNIGNNSYGDDYGFGTKGFFKAGNDLSLTLVFTLVVSILYYLMYSRKFLNVMTSIFIGLGAILIGTRVGMFLTTSIIFSFLIYLFFLNRTGIFIKLMICSILFFTSIFLVKLYNNLDSYALNRLTLESMENARTALTQVAISHINNFNGFDILIGQGADPLFGKLGRSLFLPQGFNRMVEADIYEIIGSYGFVFGGIILFFFYYICWKGFKTWIMNRNITNFCLFFLTFIFIVVGAMAGHAIKNVMVAPIYGVVVALISRNYKIQ